MAWRAFVVTPEFEAGIMHLRRNCKTESGDTDMAIVRGAHQWKGYQLALDDLINKLTEIQVTDKPIEDPPLGG